MDEGSKEFEEFSKKDLNNKAMNIKNRHNFNTQTSCHNENDVFSQNNYLYTIDDASQLALTRKIGTMQNTLTGFKAFIKSFSLGGKEDNDER